MKTIKEILKENGFTEYMHISGETAWSKANLKEYSNEWSLVDYKNANE